MLHFKQNKLALFLTKMNHFYFSIILSLAPAFGGNSAFGDQMHSTEHKHTDNTICTTSHNHNGHQHSEGNTCTEEHDHHLHKHENETICSGNCETEKHQHSDSCTEPHDHNDTHKKQSGQLPDMISVHVDEQARHSLDMRFEKVTATSNRAEKTLYGQMIIPPHAITTYALPAAGRVTFHVKSAQQVQQGDLLYTLASPDIVEMAGNVIQAQASLNRAEAELCTLKGRQRQLEKIGTRNSELNTSIQFKEAEIHSLKASLEISNNQLQLITDSGILKNNRLEVYASTDGAVQSIDMTQGAWGEQGTSALIMVSKEELEFYTTIYASDPICYKKAQLVLTNGENSELLDGTLRVTEQVDSATQSRSLYFLPNHMPKGTYAGQQARLDLYSADTATNDFISIPNSAIVKVGINDVVFIKANNDTFIMKKVETLPAKQGKTPVKGLIPGQIIVTKGGYELKYILPTGDSGKKKAAGHFHADGQFHEGEH